MNYPNLYKTTKAYRIKAPASETSDADHTGATLDAGAQGEGLLVVDIGAVTGTSPTLNLTVEHSTDGGNNWNTLTDKDGNNVTVPEQTATGLVTIGVPLDGTGPDIRTTSTLGGTSPDFTYGVAIVAGGFADLVSGGQTF